MLDTQKPAFVDPVHLPSWSGCSEGFLSHSDGSDPPRHRFEDVPWSWKTHGKEICYTNRGRHPRSASKVLFATHRLGACSFFKVS